MIIQPKLKINLLGLLHYLRFEITASLLYSSLIYFLYEQHNLMFLASFNFMPIGLFGTILSVFLAFRNNNAYARWWEARQLWGDLVNASRYFSSQVLTLIGNTQEHFVEEYTEAQKRFIYRHCAFVNLLRMQLRDDMSINQVSEYLSPSEKEAMENAINPSFALLQIQADHLKDMYRDKLMTNYELVSILGTLERFHNAQGACERIKNTPFPREYDGLVRCLIWILIGIMPIYLLGIFSDDLSKMLIIPISIAITLIIGFANKAGEIMEDPFENRVHDIPMTALCTTIERDLLSQIKHHPIPAKQPVYQGIIW